MVTDKRTMEIWLRMDVSSQRVPDNLTVVWTVDIQTTNTTEDIHMFLGYSFTARRARLTLKLTCWKREGKKP